VIAAAATFASTGPFGPTALMLILFPVLLAAPFILLAATARSLLWADPIPRWLLALLTLGACAVAFFIWPARISDRWSGFWGTWKIASIACLSLLPVVYLMEAGKRDWFRHLRRPEKTRKSKTAKRGADASGSPGVFVRDRD